MDPLGSDLAGECEAACLLQQIVSLALRDWESARGMRNVDLVVMLVFFLFH